jgi:hypothetical protein
VANADLDAMIAKLKHLPELAQRAAPEVAGAVRDNVREQISKGTDPNGNPWKPTQQGERPLKNAANALYVANIGTTILARLTGPEARHHWGRARGGIKRQVLPTNGIPSSMAKAITEVVVTEFNALMGGKS